jgi:hypothetical protein
MTWMSFVYALWAEAASTGFYSGGMYFDTSNPKILLGLLIGGMIPYFLPAIPAAFTKWFIRTWVLRSEPKVSRIFLAALLEPLCFYGGVILISYTLHPENPLIFYIVSVLLTFPNLLVIQPSDQSSEFGYHFPKRALRAFGYGLVYCCYFALTLWILYMWLW